MDLTSNITAHAIAPRALVGGVAGLIYVPLAALEGADVLAAPELGERATVVRDHLELHADAMALTVTAGLVSLVAYAVFVVVLYRSLAAESGDGSRWPVVGVVGALVGATLAAVGQIASAVALVRRDSLDDADLAQVWELSLDARTWAGIAGAVGLAGFARAASTRSTGGSGAVLPTLLARAALVLAGTLLVATVVALADDTENTRLVVVGVFALVALWVFLVSAWWVLGHEVLPHWALLLRQFVCLVLVVAAGTTGIALIVLPGSTAQIFSWGLAPEPLAALIGGFYVASAAVFAAAAAATRDEVRGLLLGAFVFASSTVVVTQAHTEVFDFDRLQAVAWLLLFPVFAVAVAVVLLAEPAVSPNLRAAPSGRARRVTPRLLAGALGALLAAGAIATWTDPLAADHWLPFALSPLGGRFLGCWLALLAVLAAWVAAHPAVAPRRLPAGALVVFPAAGFVAAVRVAPDLTGTGAIVGWIVALLTVGSLGTWLVIGSVGFGTFGPGRPVLPRVGWRR